MGGAPGTLTTQVPGVIPVNKLPPPPPGDLSVVLLTPLGGERVTFSPLDCFLGLESVLFLGVDVASTSELFSPEPEPECIVSPTRDSLLGGPGVATELLTLILLLLYHGDGSPRLEGVGGENGNLRSWGYNWGYKDRGGVPTLLPPGVGKPDIPALFPTKELLLPGEFARKVLHELVRLGASLA